MFAGYWANSSFNAPYHTGCLKAAASTGSFRKDRVGDAGAIAEVPGSFSSSRAYRAIPIGRRVAIDINSVFVSIDFDC